MSRKLLEKWTLVKKDQKDNKPILNLLLLFFDAMLKATKMYSPREVMEKAMKLANITSSAYFGMFRDQALADGITFKTADEFRHVVYYRKRRTSFRSCKVISYFDPPPVHTTSYKDYVLGGGKAITLGRRNHSINAVLLKSKQTYIACWFSKRTENECAPQAKRI